MYLSEATSNVLKFIYAILVTNNDEKHDIQKLTTYIKLLQTLSLNSTVSYELFWLHQHRKQIIIF